jgi:hypothetical protein
LPCRILNCSSARADTATTSWVAAPQRHLEASTVPRPPRPRHAGPSSRDWSLPAARDGIGTSRGPNSARLTWRLRVDPPTVAVTLARPSSAKRLGLPEPRGANRPYRPVSV